MVVSSTGTNIGGALGVPAPPCTWSVIPTALVCVLFGPVMPSLLLYKYKKQLMIEE